MSGRSLVPVMEAAEDGSGDDARTVFRAADCAAVRRVLREREMRPRRVVVLGVPAQQSAGVALAEDDHKVEQIAPDGADHPFGEGILPRRPRRADDLLLAAEAMEEVAESLEGGATVAMDEARRFRQSGAQLDAGPLGSRVLGDVEVEDAAPSVAEDDEAVEDAKGDRRIVKKSMPAAQLIWLRRKVRQVCEGGLFRRGMYLATVDWATAMPSLSNSP